MKKFFYLAILIFLTFTVHGQNSIGFEIGYLHSKTAGETEIKALQNFVGKADHKPLYSITFGLNYQLPINDYLEVKTVLYYERKGSEVIYPELTFTNQFGVIIGSESPKNKYQFNYLTLPFLLKLDWNSFFVNVGPYASLLLSQKNIRWRVSCSKFRSKICDR